MCVKIIGTEEKEFDPKKPIDIQLVGAKEIFVDYDEFYCYNTDMLVNGLEQMVKTGIGLDAEIKVNVNNSLNGLKLERKLKRLRNKLDVNEVAKSLTKLHIETDKKLSEISEMCLGKNE